MGEGVAFTGGGVQANELSVDGAADGLAVVDSDTSVDGLFLTAVLIQGQEQAADIPNSVDIDNAVLSHSLGDHGVSGNLGTGSGAGPLLEGHGVTLGVSGQDVAEGVANLLVGVNASGFALCTVSVVDINGDRLSNNFFLFFLVILNRGICGRRSRLTLILCSSIEADSQNLGNLQNLDLNRLVIAAIQKHTYVSIDSCCIGISTNNVQCFFSADLFAGIHFLNKGTGFVINEQFYSVLLCCSRRSERHSGNQQHCYQSQAQQLLHYCFHCSYLLMKY